MGGLHYRFLSLSSHTQGWRRYSCCGEFTRKGVIDVNIDFYTGIGIAVVWCVKYILIPVGVAVTARILAEKILRSQPERQKNKRSNKNRLSK